MKTVTFVYSLLLFLMVNSLAAQNPGGITNNLQFWIKADYSSGKMTFQTGKVRDWENEKSTFKISNGTAGQRPVWYDGSASGSSVDSFNYNPHVKFTQSSSTHLFNTSTSPDLLGTSGSIFVVSNEDVGSKTGLAYYSNTLYRYQVKPNFRVQTSNGVDSKGYTSDFFFVTPSYTSPSKNARIVFSRDFGANLTTRRNSTAYPIRFSNDATYYPGINAGLYVGANLPTSEYFDGRIAEVIFFNTTLHVDSTRRIESYLGVKYGITLNPNGLDNTAGYVTSAGSSIYSKGTNGTTYWNNVIGLGRDAGSGLLQKQSHTYDDSVRLYISSLASTNTGNTGSISNDQDFLMMGSTTGKLMEDAATATEKPSGVTIRMDREWKLINTSFDQTYSIQIKPAASASSYFTGGGILRLLVDTDGDFTNAAQVTDGNSGVSISYSAGIITVSVTPSLSGGLFPVDGTPVFITVAANNGNLAAEGIQFACTKVMSGVLLKWQTQAEITTDYFEVQKSYDKTNWETIAREKSRGVAGSGASYSFTDYSAMNRTVYYRIKEVSINNTAAFTAIRKIEPAIQQVTVTVYPNPAKDMIRLSWNGAQKLQQINVYTVEGRSCNVPVSIATGSANLNIETLPKGVYIIAINNGTATTYSRFAKN